MDGQDILNLIASSDTIIGLADKSSDDTVYRSTALKWANLVVDDIENRQQNFHWKFLEKTGTASTVASQHSYDLPADISGVKVLSVYERTNDVTYQYMDYSQFVKRVANPADNISTPSRLWTLYANTLRLYPVPAGVITIYMDYVKKATKFADNDTAIDIPDKYTKVVIDGILALAYKLDRQLGDEALQVQIYEGGMQKMVQDNLSSPPEIFRSTTHRERYVGSGELDGRNSILFPLDQTNM